MQKLAKDFKAPNINQKKIQKFESYKWLRKLIYCEWSVCFYVIYIKALINVIETQSISKLIKYIKSIILR